MSAHMDENAAMLAILADHRQNVVTEGADTTWRTRVKCDGESCDFYTADPSYWVAVKRHDVHLAEQIERIVAERLGRLAQRILNTVDPLGPGHEVRMQCVGVLRDEPRTLPGTAADQ